MTTLREAAQQALEALDTLKSALRVGMPEYGAEDQDELLETAITALRAALAEQAEQEPVAWVWNPASSSWERVRAFGHWQQGAIYAFGPEAPKPAKPPPLALWQIAAAVEQCKANVEGEFLVEFARAIERAHGIGEHE